MHGKASRKSDPYEIFFNQRHPNSQKIHAWKPKAYSKKPFDQKIRKYSRFQTINTNNSKHFFRFHIMTLSLSYSRTILDTFPDIKQYWHFQIVTGKQYYTLFNTTHMKQTILPSTILKFTWLVIDGFMEENSPAPSQKEYWFPQYRRSPRNLKFLQPLATRYKKKFLISQKKYSWMGGIYHGK